MSTRVEFESINPLSEYFENETEYFENEDREDETRGRGRMLGRTSRGRTRFNFANRNRRFMKPPRFTRFIRRFRRPFPRPFPLPPPVWGPVEPPRQPGNQGAPRDSGPSGSAPLDDGWGPQGAPVEATDQGPPEGNGQAPSVDGAMEPGDGDAAQASDVQQPGSDEELFEFFPQTEFEDNEFGLMQEYENWQRQLNGGRSRKSEKCNCHQAQTASSEAEFGAYDRESPAPGRKQPTINLGEVVICGGRPFASLDNFSFNKSTLRKDSIRNHPAQVNAIAREIMNRAARRRPVPTVCIVGHTDTTGKRDYNYGLGLQRAKAVKAALCKALGRHATSITFVVNSMGEMNPASRGTTPATRARNRRVDVHLLSQRQAGEQCAPTGGRRLPRDPAGGCGVPTTSARREFEIAQELGELEQTAPARRVRVQPNLCLYQEASNTSHRNHFQHQALGTARRISAIGSPDASNCNSRIGATPYSSGADIVNAIRAAWQCAGRRPIESVHIFGHSGSYGLFGATGGTAGLYQNSFSLDAAQRSGGGRNIADIPTDVLSNNVIFVLHGCNQASGCNVQGDDDNFAQSLLEHLSGALTNPRVYGHYNSGCAGRNNSWCLYSKTIPKGRANSRPTYTDPGGCTPATREFEFQSEEAMQRYQQGTRETWEREASPANAGLRFVRDFSGPAAECNAALVRAGKTKAQALTIINSQIGVAIAMLRRASTSLKRGSRTNTTRNIFRKIFRVNPEFVPTWLKQTETIKDRGDVVATRCKRVADLLASGTIKYFCRINTTNCPDCGNDSSGFGCSSFGNHRVVCLGDAFWDDMKAGNVAGVLATLMHEPFHIFYGRYVTEHVMNRGKFGGIDCIVQFVFERNNRAAPALESGGCAGRVVRSEIGELFA